MPVRGEEFAGLDAGPCSPPSRAMRFPLESDDGEARTKIGHLAVTAMAGPSSPMMKFGDLPPPQAHSAQGRCEVFHWRPVCAVAVEHLDAVVLAVGDIDEAVAGVGDDVVDDVELAGMVPGSPQVFSSLPSGVNLWTQALP